MKKAFIGVLASLMLAGAISAVSGATTNTTTEKTVIVGDGSAPIPMAEAPAITNGQETSVGK